jgi:hypothetical protein
MLKGRYATDNQSIPQIIDAEEPAVVQVGSSASLI